MRVATYTQPAAVTRGSLAALTILVLTVLLGTTVAGRLAEYFVPTSGGLLTFVWLALYGLASLGLMFGQGINWISWLMRYRILLVILLLGCILSVAWAVDPHVSAERVVHLVGCSLLGIYLGFTMPLLTMLRVLAVVLGVTMLASAAAALALPDLGITAYENQLVWSGVFNSKNHLGFWSATGVLLYVALSDSTRSILLRLLCYLMAGVCLALLVFSQSATALLAMLVGGALSLYLYIANRFRLGFVRMAVLAVLFIGLVSFAAANIDTAELVGRSEDLTGRGEVWAQTWKLIMNRPLTGYGYGVLWFPTEATLWIQQSLTDFTWVVFHAHNGFLQVASEIGLPLAVIALLMVAQQMVEIIYCQYQRQQTGTLFVLAFVIAYLIGNFSEARFLVTRELYWILFIALPVSMLRQINLIADESASDERADEGSPDGEPFGRDRDPSAPSRARERGDAHRPGNAWADASGRALPGAGSALVPAGTAAMPWGEEGAAAGTASDGTHAAGAGGPYGGARATRVRARWQDDDGWEDGTFEEVRPTPATPGARVATRTVDDDEPFARGEVAIDLGDTTVARGADVGDETVVLAPEDWVLAEDDGAFVHEAREEDRFDKAFDATGDGTDDWVDLPLDEAGRR